MALLKQGIRRWRRAAAWLAAFAVSIAAAAPLQEYQVKAVFVLNFARFVDWPPETFSSPAQPMLICVVGDDPFNSYLDDALRDERVEGHPLALRRVSEDDVLDACRIVFISQSAAPRLSRILQSVKSDRTLTVSDIPGFVEQGGMIGLDLEDKRVRVRINPDAARAAGLVISSKLLRIADVVSSVPRG